MSFVRMFRKGVNASHTHNQLANPTNSIQLSFTKITHQVGLGSF